MRFTWLGAGVLVAVAAACGADEGTATGSTCPPDSTLTYETFGKAFLTANCTRCHASGTDNQQPLLESVDAVRANAAAIDRAAASGPKATNTIMPEEGSVPDADRKKLGEWLACGAP